MTAVVWVSSWQLQCCGDSFAVGGRVEWTVEDAVDRAWLDAALGPQQAARVTHTEDHHADHDDLRRLSGRVVSILAAWGAFAPTEPDARTLSPVPGSARFVDVTEPFGADGRGFPGLQLNGWLVEVHEEA